MRTRYKILIALVLYALCWLIFWRAGGWQIAVMMCVGGPIAVCLGLSGWADEINKQNEAVDDSME